MITKTIKITPEELQKLVERKYNVKIINMRLHGTTGMTATLI